MSGTLFERLARRARPQAPGLRPRLPGLFEEGPSGAESGSGRRFDGLEELAFQRQDSPPGNPFGGPSPGAAAHHRDAGLNPPSGQAQASQERGGRRPGTSPPGQIETSQPRNAQGESYRQSPSQPTRLRPQAAGMHSRLFGNEPVSPGPTLQDGRQASGQASGTGDASSSGTEAGSRGSENAARPERPERPAAGRTETFPLKALSAAKGRRQMATMGPKAGPSAGDFEAAEPSSLAASPGGSLGALDSPWSRQRDRVPVPEPTVTVSIGRIVVRAERPPQPRRPAPKPRSQGPSLEDYLARRTRGGSPAGGKTGGPTGGRS